VSGCLLVNYVYCHPVGHAIEALHLCHGYHRADPTLRISVALNADTATELAALCPFVDAVHPVTVNLFDRRFNAARAVAAIPTGWDWVVDDPRGHQPEQRALFPALGAYYAAAADRFAGSTLGIAGAAPPAYSRGEPFRLTLPDTALTAGKLLLGNGSPRDGAPPNGAPRIAVLPGGGGPAGNYPSVRSWSLILGALAARWPDAVFGLLGKYRANGQTTTGFPGPDFETLLATTPHTVDVADLPLTEQLAAVAGCDVLISPHSGFGMAALAVGTPWLSIAGNAWPEYYFPGVPFYSVLPDITTYPAYHQLGAVPDPVEDDGPRAPSMCHARIRADLDEIIEGAARLVERRYPFQQAMTEHLAKMVALRGGRAELLWSMDDVHRDHLTGAPR
jgi:hypothetical protein